MTGDDLSSLRADLYSPDRAVRESAVARIVELYDTQTTRLLTEALLSETPEVRDRAIVTLAKLVTSEDDMLALGAARPLAEAGALDALAEAYGRGTTEVRMSATLLLGACTDPRALGVAQDALRDEDAHVRAVAIELVGRLG
ncbi:MAG: hypothetical protein JXE06_04140 [Coriobacteriia bacterium]|nr:hypothetical protein [Coriobacteriia bacterium]MBN2821780.1 hypothetical protein [Coriobacteriia bacterium]